MQNELIREYLTALGKTLAERFTAWTVEDTDEGPILVLTAPLPNDESSQIGYSVALTPVSNDILLYDLIITLFTDVPEKCYDDIRRVTAVLNNCMIIGSFALYEDTAEVVFRNGVFFGAETDVEAATVNILKTLEAMEEEASVGLDLQMLISGELTADGLIAEICDIGGETA